MHTLRLWTARRLQPTSTRRRLAAAFPVPGNIARPARQSRSRPGTRRTHCPGSTLAHLPPHTRWAPCNRRWPRNGDSPGLLPRIAESRTLPSPAVGDASPTTDAVYMPAGNRTRSSLCRSADHAANAARITATSSTAASPCRHDNTLRAVGDRAPACPVAARTGAGWIDALPCSAGAEAATPTPAGDPRKRHSTSTARRRVRTSELAAAYRNSTSKSGNHVSPWGSSSRRASIASGETGRTRRC